MNNSMTPAIQINSLVKKYDNGTEALKGVSLSIPRGEFFALLGPNGAGKTTIIGVLTGLVNKTSGTVSVLGEDIDMAQSSTREHIGVVPQEINLNIFEKPLEIVVNQAGYYGIPRSVALPRAHELLEKLGLGDKKFVISRTLSGGMKRRLLIARALIHKPSILVLDEPTAGVDVELRRGMWDFLKTLTAEGVTILLTTHYLEEAEQLCKYVAIINKGEIISNGTMQELLNRKQSKTFSIESADAITPEHFVELKKAGFVAVSPTSIEITVSGDGAFTTALRAVTASKIIVKNIEQKGGKLEDIFVELTS